MNDQTGAVTVQASRNVALTNQVLSDVRRFVLFMHILSLLKYTA